MQRREKLYFKGKEIRGFLEITDHGMVAGVFGGDLSHIGAVSVVDAKGVLQTVILDGHKDYHVSNMWAERLFEKYRVPVSVSAGIHYEQITKEEIGEVLALCSQLLEGVML